MKLILINDKTYWNKNEWTFLQLCFLGNIENIPRFCYHEQLSVAGNCRMCLIEDIKSLKPVVSCTIIPLNNSSFFTNTIKVKKSREYMLEFLLINHPLDCPICCQGGECDLQDLTELIGSDKGRFYEEKRAVLDKNIGPIIKTAMNRCIHCTRCIRFSIEVMNSYQLGLLGRGMNMEIGSYLNNYLTHEFQGNLIDICPVGALTSKLKSYNIRSWECESFLTINIFDFFLDNIRIELRGNKIIRILPVYNFFWKNEWLSDNFRYINEKLLKPRIKNPLFKLKFFFLRCSWNKIYYIIRKFFINSLQWILYNKIKYFDFLFTFNSLINFSIYNFSLIFLKQLSFSKKLQTNKINNFLLKEQFKTSSDFFTKFSYIIFHIDYLRFKYPQLYLLINTMNLSKHIFVCNDNTIYNKNISMISLNQLKLLLVGKNNISLYLIKDFIFILINIFIELWNDWHLIIQSLLLNKININLQKLIDVQKQNTSLNFYSYTVKIIYNIDILFNILNNTSKILYIFQGSFIEKMIEFANIILPITFGYEMPSLQKQIIKNLWNIYKFKNTSIKKVRSIIWNNNNFKTAEDSILLFQLYLELFNTQNYMNIYYIFNNSYKVILNKIKFCTKLFFLNKFYLSSVSFYFLKNLIELNCNSSSINNNLWFIKNDD